MANPDYVIVGGGINGLVAASVLGKNGAKVLVLDRNDRVGGCLRTEEITAPGFLHDVMATTLVLFLDLARLRRDRQGFGGARICGREQRSADRRLASRWLARAVFAGPETQRRDLRRLCAG